MLTNKINEFDTGYHFLFNQLSRLGDQKGIASIMMMGSGPGVGVTTVSLSFTNYLATKMGQRVLLGDASFRSPRIHEFYNIPQKPGLAELLAGEAKPGEAIHKTDIPGLYVLPSGDKNIFPRKLAARATKVKEAMATMSQHFDLAVFDGAPLSFSPETHYLAGIVDGVLLVTWAEKTRREVLKATRDQLEQTGGRILGGILNRRKFHIPAWVYKRMS